MKLSHHKKKLLQTSDITGLLRADFEYNINDVNCTFNWTGPLIPPEEWHKMLSFFRWTNTEHHSESQVRLFVNTQLKTWKIWPFPQEARTGMNAREIPGEEFDLQRAMFKDSEGWLYLGTVHHHCSMGAFQSSVDHHNEANQDGLHVTIGCMDKDYHDMHCRFVIGENMFDPDMSMFWEIGTEVANMTPSRIHNEIARHQMSIHRENGFPDEWKKNVIERRYTVGSPTGFCETGPGQYFKSYGPSGSAGNNMGAYPCGGMGGFTHGNQGGSDIKDDAPREKKVKKVKEEGSVLGKPPLKPVLPSNIEMLKMKLAERAGKALDQVLACGYILDYIYSAMTGNQLSNECINAMLAASSDWLIGAEDLCKEVIARYEQNRTKKENQNDELAREWSPYDVDWPYGY